MGVLFRVTHRRTLAPAIKSSEQLAREHEMLNDELEDYKSYRKQIKNRCFICTLWFKNDWGHYMTFGNSCVVCSGRIIRVRFNSKQRTKTELTKDEATNLLAVRKKYISEHQLDLAPWRRRKKNRYAIPPRED